MSRCVETELFRSVSEACRGLRTEFRPFSRVRHLNSPASLSPQNSRFPDHEMERPEQRLSAFR